MLRAILREIYEKKDLHWLQFFFFLLVAPGCTSTTHTGTPSLAHNNNKNMCAKRNAAYVLWKRILWAMNKFAASFDHSL